MTTPTKRPLRRDAEENRQRLLEAAAEVFAESGLEATMDEVAARAGVGVGTAYRRFANKDELIGALFEERMEELTELTERALAEEDPWQGIVRYLEESIALHSCDRGLKEVVLSSPRGREYVAEARKRLKPGIDQLVARAHESNRLRPGIEATDLMMVQMMVAATFEPAEGGHEVWRRFLALIVEGLRGDRDQPLPSTALSIDDLDAVMEQSARPARRR